MNKIINIVEIVILLNVFTCSIGYADEKTGILESVVVVSDELTLASSDSLDAVTQKNRDEKRQMVTGSQYRVATVSVDEKNADSAQHDIVPVPLPAAVWTFLTALLGILGLSRKKKSE